jgi:hypothetical protein
MKPSETRLTLWSLGLLLAFPAIPCKAHFDGCDNFNGNSIDASRWSGPVVYSGVGWLTETNQRLEFTTTNTPTTQDACILQWNLNPGSYTQDWELKVDLNIGMPVFTNASPQPSVHLHLLVSPSNNVSANAIFNVEFGQDAFRYVHTLISSNGGYAELATKNTPASNLAVRIAFDSGAKVLSAWFDEDAANCGYSWRPLGSTVVPASWGMTTNAFSAVLMGIAHNVAVASTNDVFLDNFRAAPGSIPRPWIRHIGNNVAISWPTNAPGCQLESTATLTPPVCWAIATNTVTTAGTYFTVTDTISSQSKFFRLNRNYGCQ